MVLNHWPFFLKIGFEQSHRKLKKVIFAWKSCGCLKQAVHQIKCLPFKCARVKPFSSTLTLSNQKTKLSSINFSTSNYSFLKTLPYQLILESQELELGKTRLEHTNLRKINISKLVKSLKLKIVSVTMLHKEVKIDFQSRKVHKSPLNHIFKFLISLKNI